MEALYRRPCTTRPEPGHKIYPYLLRGMAITRPNHVWAMDITYIPMERGFVYLAVVLDWATRRVLSWRLSITMEACLLRRNPGGCLGPSRQAGDIQHRPGLAVHRRGLHRRARQQRIAISMDGKGAWRDNVFIERLWRSVKYEEVYLRASQSVQRGAPLDRPISRFLQWPPTTFEP